MKNRTAVLPEGSWSAGLTEAIRLRDEAADRRPRDDDAPPASAFPMSAAARVALNLARTSRARREAPSF